MHSLLAHLAACWALAWMALTSSAIELCERPSRFQAAPVSVAPKRVGASGLARSCVRARSIAFWAAIVSAPFGFAQEPTSNSVSELSAYTLGGALVLGLGSLTLGFAYLCAVDQTPVTLLGLVAAFLATANGALVAGLRATGDLPELALPSVIGVPSAATVTIGILAALALRVTLWTPVRNMLYGVVFYSVLSVVAAAVSVVLAIAGGAEGQAIPVKTAMLIHLSLLLAASGLLVTAREADRLRGRRTLASWAWMAPVGAIGLAPSAFGPDEIPSPAFTGAVVATVAVAGLTAAVALSNRR